MATILVVDDEIGIRDLLSEILTEEGHTVDLAENARQARLYREEQEPDLVLLDIWMPDTDGVTLLKEWSAQKRLTMPVIMMSGHATIDTAVEATKIGALNFLEKPITLQKLKLAVERALMHGKQKKLLMSSLLQSNALQKAAAVPASENTTPEQTIKAESNQPLVWNQSEVFAMTLRDARDVFEKAYFEYHLAKERGSITRVAQQVGLERTHLYRKLKQLGVIISKQNRC